MYVRSVPARFQVLQENRYDTNDLNKLIKEKGGRMERQEFIEYLSQHPALYAFEEKGGEERGIMVTDNVYNTTTFFADRAIKEHALSFLLKRTHHGKNVEQITRVTGYFSKVNAWNKGKKAELKDRFRSDLEGIQKKVSATVE
jgi:hypothetical protein